MYFIKDNKYKYRIKKNRVNNYYHKKLIQSFATSLCVKKTF